MKSLIVWCGICFLSFAPLFAQSSAFTFQGRLGDNDNPANGVYDFQFSLFPGSTGGTTLTAPIALGPVIVSNGLFTVTVDFGSGVFDGSDRWLEIGVKTNGGSGYIVLSPRQAVTPSPYSIRALNVAASALSGTIPDARLSSNIPRLDGDPVFSGSVTFGSSGTPFSVGSTTKVNNLNSDLLDGLDSSAFWKTTGNSGTSPGSHSLGTTDNQALFIVVNNTRALMLEPSTNGAPNVVGGANSVSPGFSGVALLGGGGAFPNSVQTDFGTIVGGRANTVLPGGADAFIGAGFLNNVQGERSVIAGGRFNTIETNANEAAITGGLQNRIYQDSSYAHIGGGNNSGIGANSPSTVIGGGSFNLIQNNTHGALIGGGEYNLIQSGAVGSSIGGGIQNQVQAASDSSTIAGGYSQVIRENAPYSTLGGGQNNIIHSTNSNVTIGGGAFNIVQSDSVASTISGGRDNVIEGTSGYSSIAGGVANVIERSSSSGVISGGSLNRIETNSAHGFIGGGYNNLIKSNASHAAIPGGYYNVAGGQFSFAAGRQAKATNDNAFVWSDGFLGDFGSTAANQFLVHATGGLGINTNNPVSALHVNGIVTASGFSGSGAGLNALSASNITSGTLADARLSTNVARLNASSTFTGGVNFTPAPGGPPFSVSSNSKVTNLNADLLDGLDSSSFAALSHVHSADAITSGTLADLRLSTNVALLVNGRLPDSRLSTNAALLDTAQTFTAATTFQSLNAADGSGSLGQGGLLHIGGYGANGDAKLIKFGDGSFCYIGENGADDLMELRAGKFSFVNGYVGIGVTNPATPLHVAGTVTATAYNTSSDRNLKNNLKTVDGREVLAKVASLPIQSWNFKDEQTRHVGPMAQDFYALFNVGSDDKHIATVDADGVALAAIQGLNELVKEKDARITALEKNVAALKTLVNALLENSNRKDTIND